MKSTRTFRVLMIAAGAAAFNPGAAQAQATSPGEKHFDAKGNLPSMYTIELRKGVSATLPFEDKRDFDEAKKGFIAEPPYMKIMADAGNVAWDMGSYQWLLQGKDFQSIHPSLQRQAVLNMAYGLYEVVPGRIYQVRGFDLANISFVKGDTGWIVFDPLTAKETARAALDFINEKLGKRPVAGRRLFAFACRPFRRRARRGGRGRRDQRQGQGDRAGRLHAGCDRGERLLRQCDVAPHPIFLRRAAAARSLRPRGPVDRQERGERQCRADRAEPPDQEGFRGCDDRRREDGVPEHAGHRGAGRDEHLVPAVQGLLGRREHHRHHPQRLHAARRAGAQCAELVEADQRRALPVRAGRRSDVRLPQLAALGQRAHPGSDAHATRHLRQPQQPVAALRQSRRDDQRDPERLQASAEPVEAMAGAQLSRVGGAQQPRRHQPLPRLLGRQSR